MKKILAAVFLSSLLAADAGARFEGSAAVARAQGMGGSFVSLADDASSLFINPAGMPAESRAAWYFDYDEPAGVSGGRETRAAIDAASARTRVAAGWYRLGLRGGESEDLIIVNAARKLVEGTQASFLSIGASASIGRAPLDRVCCPSAGDAWSGVAADFGLLVKPLPVISIGYAIGNAFNERFEDAGAGDSWGRTQRWGVSYFWEDRIVLSISGERSAGNTTFHSGLVARAAVPLEILAGFSDGNVTGGVRWTGRPLAATVSFLSDGERGVTWMIACEMAVFRERGGEKR